MIGYSHHYTPGEVAAIGGGLAIAAGIYGCYLYSRAQATLRWRPVDGKITWSMLEDRERSSRRDPHTQYRAAIKYSYALGGVPYEGTRVYYGATDWRDSDTLARTLVDRYPPGKMVRVFVDPAKPSESVLARGQDHIGRRWILIAAALGVVSGLVFAFRANLGNW